ncbi:MAG TPA: zinc-ribbon domain-containing protein, partial [Candidatus Sulfomarinibacteraceae bacterium]|nr:zinc-ribbon domain-containing protein [Candidatus Sulfomarinibacteraceae bacterium]
MTCTNCGASNPNEAKFCIECGSPVSAACPSCGTPVVAGASFCLECGTRLGDQPPESTHDPST